MNSTTQGEAERTVSVTTGARLHVGMFSFGPFDEEAPIDQAPRRFGGVGWMVDQPAVRLRASISPSGDWEARGPHAQRALAAAKRVVERLRLRVPPPLLIEVLDAPPEHVGLGTGTQLTMAVATALHRFRDLEGDVRDVTESDLRTGDGSSIDFMPGTSPLRSESPAGDEEVSEWIARTNRAKRSTVGTYGGLRGGFIIEAGKRRLEELSPLVGRVDVPSRWRFLLVRPKRTEGLSGAAERQAFAQLSPPSFDVTAELYREATRRMFPAVQRGDFWEFAGSLTRFGRLAGACFAPAQHGEYCTERVADVAARLIDLGAPAAVQSSWGPTLVVPTLDADAAKELVLNIQQAFPEEWLDVVVAGPKNDGMTVVVSS
ncbi:MAG TPA: hypothetical protein VGE52_15060 [Pirellulales bacterium]